ncbi:MULTISPECIES: DNA repair protein RecO [unclassified Psychrobacillus]|uniref:DNA repair protein RecO n=1 Tax=unclassified Psychrobacillus TaxID=2636677 RepID=UPI00146C3C07|nr:MULTISPECIES: DNA repair protein RecO [unclassified Psychrobacillus]MCM3358400.1 DNA repair protein RecO [Psychrobacillus sp. MER TA 171]NME04304.1 DNA repair protein RecO [Psychrobacillus sp. BL-248-WT-3]
MLQKVEGIVLRTSSYGETDKVVTIFSRELGKRAAMARGAKKPTSRLSSISQPFTYAYFLIQQGRGMGSLQQGEIIDSMRVIREDIFTTAYASFIMELVDKLIDDESPKPHVFTILQQALEAISEGYDPEAISLFVEWKMLSVAGIYPVLHQCANCGATDGEFAFSFAQIGFLCHRCFTIDPYLIRLTPSQVKLIRTFYTVPIDQVGKLTLKKETKGFIKKIVRTIYNEQVGVRLKSQGFLDQMEKTPEFFQPKKDSHSEE